MPTIATPLSVRSRPSAASPAATCWTYGQWLQMKVTTSAGPVSASRLTVAPVAGSGSVNGGADVPRANIVDSVAMPARISPRRLRPGTVASCEVPQDAAIEFFGFAESDINYRSG